MATTLYFRDSPGSPEFRSSLGTNAANLAGSAQGWTSRFLSTTRGSSAKSVNKTVSAGPTAGQEISGTAHWISPALAADVTISGTVTMNLRMSEGNTSCNATAQCVIERIDSEGVLQETVLNSQRGTEMGTTEAAQNWTDTPTSTVFHRGDRIRIRVAANDATALTLASAAVTFFYDGLSAATGDSFVTFNETLTFLTSDPSGSTVYLRDTTSDIDPNGSSYDAKEAWTTQGSSDATAVTDTAAGWTAPLLATKTAGGNFVEWFTKPLTAFTLSGPIKAQCRGLESNAAANCSWRVEIAVVDNDGTSPTVWGVGTTNQELGTSSSAQTFFVTGDDTAVTQGQRIRIRVYIDDTESQAMGATFTATFGYNGASPGNGDSFLIFGETLHEQVVLTQPSETDESQPITSRKDLALNATAPSETDEALALTAAVGVVVGQATELDEVLALMTPAPGTLEALAVSATQIDLSWGSVAGGVGYDIERDGVVIVESQPGTTYSDTGLTPATTYTYRVRTVV